MTPQQASAFKECYIMQRDDIERFADTLADGFSQYALFQYICNGTYDHDKMALFWKVSLALLPDNAICIADSKSANSVLIYIPPKSREAGILTYLMGGGLKMAIKMGLRGTSRLLRFKSESEKTALQHQTDNDGYLMAFATRLDKQGQHYGKPLIEALLRYLDASGEGCYLETLKTKNVDLYKHFAFELIEQKPLEQGKLTLYAMHRASK